MKLKPNTNIKNELTTDLFCKILKSITGCDAVTEHPFCPGRKFRSDYAILEHKIAIEVEGGIWRKGGGAHSRPANIIRDIEKQNLYVLHGWRLIRVQPENLMKSETFNLIKQLIENGKSNN